VYISLAVTLATVAGAGFAGWYVHSILHEPQAAVAAAAAEAQAAAATAASVVRGLLRQQLSDQQAAAAEQLPSNYTVVVMSYSRRLASLPLVINQLARCPSAAEVLLVWNGDDPPPPTLFEQPAKLRVRTERQVGLAACDAGCARCPAVELAAKRQFADAVASAAACARFGGPAICVIAQRCHNQALPPATPRRRTP
jgi:hypothetical protein